MGRALVLIAGLALAGAACDPREPYPDAGTVPQVMVSVVNGNSHDIDVYAIQLGARMRVGRLWSTESGEIEIGPPLVESGEMALEAVAIGLNQSYRTPPIVIMGHTYIHLQVGEALDSSTYSVSYGEDLDSIPLPAGETS